jgi:hypothetical protein
VTSFILQHSLTRIYVLGKRQLIFLKWMLSVYMGVYLRIVVVIILQLLLLSIQIGVKSAPTKASGYLWSQPRWIFFRFCSHFRSVHRGSFLMEMKTTAVRKLLPDQWGFLCPVHAPDGGPCGLLSHLSLKCLPRTHPEPNIGNGLIDLDRLLLFMGVIPTGAGGNEGEDRAVVSFTNFPVCLDGRVVGFGRFWYCNAIAAHLRSEKIERPRWKSHSFPLDLLGPRFRDCTLFLVQQEW